MENSSILKILNNNNLTEEEKTALLRKLAEEAISEKSVNKGAESIDKTDDLNEEYVVIIQRENLLPRESEFYIKPEVVKKSDILERIEKDTADAVKYFEDGFMKGKQALKESEAYGKDLFEVYNFRDGEMCTYAIAGIAIRKDEYERIQKKFKPINKIGNAEEDKEYTYRNCDGNVFEDLDPDAVLYGIVQLKTSGSIENEDYHSVEDVPVPEKLFWVDYNKFYDELKEKRDVIGADIDIACFDEKQKWHACYDKNIDKKNRSFEYIKDYNGDYFRSLYEVMFITSDKLDYGYNGSVLNTNIPFCDLLISANNYKKYFSIQDLINHVSSILIGKSKKIEDDEYIKAELLRDNLYNGQNPDELVEQIRFKTTSDSTKLADEIVQNIMDSDINRNDSDEVYDFIYKLLEKFEIYHEVDDEFCDMIISRVAQNKKKM